MTHISQIYRPHFFIPFLLIIFCSSVLSQNELPRLKFLGIETGCDFLETGIRDFDFIRGDISMFNSDVPTNQSFFYFKYYTGLKIEIRSRSNKFGLLSGLRYTVADGVLGKSDYIDEKDDYFYVLLEKQDLSTNYLRVSSVNQGMHYIGFPLEIRFMPYSRKIIRLFFKAATEFNILVDEQKSISFYNDEMSIYEDDILKKFGDPDSFYSMGRLSAGIKLGRENTVNLNFEVILPAFYLSEHSTGIFEPEFGGGLQLNLQIPLHNMNDQ